RFGFFLNLNLGRQNTGRYSGNRDISGFRAAKAVKNVLLIACSDNLAEGCQRRSDQIDASDEFVGPAVDVDAINHNRSYLERLRTRSVGCGESARNVFKEKTERLALLFCFFDEHLAQLSIFDRMRGFDDQIALSSDAAVTRSLATVSVRLFKTGHR